MKAEFTNESELLRWVYDIAQEGLDKKNDADYEVNRHQMRVFKKAVDYFTALVDTSIGEKIEYNIRSPKQQNGYITVTMQSVDFMSEKDKIEEFCSILSESISLSIYPKSDGDYIYIGMVIPNLYIERKKKNP